MSYKKNEYIIENDIDNMNQPSMVKEAQLPDGFEIEETQSRQNNVIDEIVDTAEQEGLNSKEEFLGGEGASPEEVLSAMKNEGMSEGARKKKEQYEEKQLDNFRTVTATRDLLLGRVKKPITVTIPVVVETPDANTGEIIEEAINMEFKVKRLTESENTHLLNHKLIGKDIADMTDEEYAQSAQFRSNLLATAVVEPKLTAEQWRNETDNALTMSLYEEVNKILTESDDVSRFR